MGCSFEDMRRPNPGLWKSWHHSQQCNAAISDGYLCTCGGSERYELEALKPPSEEGK